ncbi:type II secretion system protein [Moritella sp. 24]|uniref:pilus assembly FimT family protein n=1 Tax=Moritella sp. 24 TaxID=2746230 RepID=UPI001BAE0486|nr:prepilin-type N-terminal cleavage/methylation domain-containing protein [Moritella sp. 24]QUM75262.1 type II secretion system protein [Moritella sp. 24]
MNKQQGFTLIELTIVTIILGILAVSAIPKFTNLSSDARLATLKGMEGALRSGVNLIHAKAVITHQDVNPIKNKFIVANIDGIKMTLHSGYPDGNWINGVRYAISLDDVDFLSSPNLICDADWCGRGDQKRLPSTGEVIIHGQIAKVYPRGYSWNNQCGVYYINRYDGSKPEIGLETKHCK